MLEKPVILDEVLLSVLSSDYGLRVESLTFLPLGADSNTAVYRVNAADGRVYFFKLRLGNFEETSVTVPAFLQARGIAQVMAPILTRDGASWTSLGDYRGILYPFIEGQNGFERELSDRQWVDLGAALRAIHAIELPADLAGQVRRETFSLRWCKIVRDLMAGDAKQWSDDPPARRLWAFMTAHRDEITTIVERAESLWAHAQTAEQRGANFVLCHSDLHGGNVLLNGEDLYIVDWDNPLFAPKERDLMFFGGGIGRGWNRAREEALFYQGYFQGDEQISIDWPTLAYYRYVRIVEDMAIYGEEILTTSQGGEDREQSVYYFIESFGPGQVVEIAHRTFSDHNLLAYISCE